MWVVILRMYILGVVWQCHCDHRGNEKEAWKEKFMILIGPRGVTACHARVQEKAPCQSRSRREKPRPEVWYTI